MPIKPAYERFTAPHDADSAGQTLGGSGGPQRVHSCHAHRRTEALQASAISTPETRAHTRGKQERHEGQGNHRQ